MIRRPPKSTLFPTPPLFQSREPADPRRARVRPGLLPGGDHPPQRRCPELLARGRGVGRRAGDRARMAGPRPDRDRKSTRLNSSHANISYAVFCLKKKKKLEL